MSAINGRKVICDRCGKETFVKCIGEGEADGGYTRWNKFEPLPKGWGWAYSKDLCPDCLAKFNAIEKGFMEGKDFVEG